MSARMPDPNPTPDLVPLIGVRKLFVSEPVDWTVWAEGAWTPIYVPLPTARHVSACDPGAR